MSVDPMRNGRPLVEVENLSQFFPLVGGVRNQIFAAPHLIIFPGGALALSVLAFNLLGDGIRDALDPRLNR